MRILADDDHVERLVLGAWWAWYRLVPMGLGRGLWRVMAMTRSALRSRWDYLGSWFWLALALEADIVVAAQFAFWIKSQG